MNDKLQKEHCVWIIVGPTAVGKTVAAIELALKLDTEIISADSRQCYKEMSIGVARPSIEELAAVPHHFIGSHSIRDEVNAVVFENYAHDLTAQIFSRKKSLVMVGGTGLYIKAFEQGLDNIPSVDPALREAIIKQYEKMGLSWLQEKVAQIDPLFFNSGSANSGEQHNPQRLMRAWEVMESTGRSIRSFQQGARKERSFEIKKIGLELPRQELYDRINHRVDDMMKAGLLAEVEKIFLEHDIIKGLPVPSALNTVGYAELYDHLAGKCSIADAVEKIKINTRHYAKRQMTWFRRDPTISWMHPAHPPLAGATRRVTPDG